MRAGEPRPVKLDDADRQRHGIHRVPWWMALLAVAAIVALIALLDGLGFER